MIFSGFLKTLPRMGMWMPPGTPPRENRWLAASWGLGASRGLVGADLLGHEGLQARGLRAGGLGLRDGFLEAGPGGY